ncbi:MAG TPA: hypothetical protein VF747_06635 [Blastocatellia bacterium]|jgi:hypothetical protein
MGRWNQGRNKLRAITQPLRDYFCAYAGSKGKPAAVPCKVQGASAEHAARMFDMGQGRNPEHTVLVWTPEMIKRGSKPFTYNLTNIGATRLSPMMPAQKIRGFHDDVM